MNSLIIPKNVFDDVSFMFIESYLTVVFLNLL